MNIDRLKDEIRKTRNAWRAKQSGWSELPEAEGRKVLAEADKLYDKLCELQDKLEDAEEEERGNAVDTSRRPNQPDVTARGAGRHYGDDDIPITYALRPEHRMAARARENGADAFEGLRLGGLIRSMVAGPKNDHERRALAEGTDASGGYTVPELLSSQLIDLVRDATVSIRAGARTVPLSSDTHHIAKVATDPVPAWRAENAAVVESEPTFTRISMAPKSLAVMFKVSRELLEDSLNLETELPRIISAAMAVELDQAILWGNGSASQPLGLTNQPGIHVISHGLATLDNYTPLVRARTKVAISKHPGVTAFIMHPKDAGRLAELTDTTGQPLMPPKLIADVPQLETTSVPTAGSPDETSIITGFFPRLLIGIRNSVRIEVLRERYAENYQYGFLAALRADVAVEHASAFCQISNIQNADIN